VTSKRNGNDKPGKVEGITVYKRGRKWWFRVTTGRNILTDEPEYEYGGGFDTDTEAFAAALKAKEQHAQNRRVRPSNITVGEFFAEWMTSIKGTVKATTYASYEDYQAWIKPTIWKKKLQKVDVQTLNALYRHLLENGRIKSADNNTRMYEYWEAQRAAGKNVTRYELAAAVGVTPAAAGHAITRYKRGRVPTSTSRGLSVKTVKNVHRMIHAALKDAVAWRYMEWNPAEHAALPREKRRGTTHKGDTWTPSELAAWLAVALVDRDAGVWVLAATSGMRRSELAGANRNRLDLDGAALAVEDTRVVAKGRAVNSDGKSDAGWRTISLDPLTVAYLRRHLAMLDKERELFGDSYHDGGWLVCHPDGRPVHPDTITDRFNRLVDLAGVKRIRLHDVRHTYVTTSLDAGVDPKIVADRVGDDPETILRIYTHKSTGKDRGAAETVAGVLLGIGWTCEGCGAAYIGTPPDSGRCRVCDDEEGGAGVPIPA
jgi:integrase